MSATKRLLSPMKFHNGLASVKKQKLFDHDSIKITDKDHEGKFDFVFDEDDGFDMEAFEAAEKSDMLTPRLDLRNWQRCIVDQVDRCKHDLVIKLRADSEKASDKENEGVAMCTCYLQGPWCTTAIKVGDVISIKGVWDARLDAYKVDIDHGFCVTNPDTMISGTSVVGSIFCQRKAVLQDKFRGVDANSKVMVIGSMVHELLQEVLAKNLKTYNEIDAVAQKMLSSLETAYTLYASQMTREETTVEVQKFVPNILSFVQQYVHGEDPPVLQKDTFQGCITKINDIEENLWLPQLGLKGKIDVSVRVSKRRKSPYTSTVDMPLELKTGRASFSTEHKGQLILYQMMLSAMGKKTESGLLLYLREGIMREVQGSHNEQRGLISLRNDLAYYLSRQPALPPIGESQISGEGKLVQPFELPEPISHHSACSTCAYNTICCSFAKTDANLNLNPNHPLQKVMAESTAHLTEQDHEYFMRWCGLLSLEEQEAKKSNFIRSLWTETPKTRQSQGRCIMNLLLSDGVTFEESQFVHTFKMAQRNAEDQMDLLISGFSLGEYVIVSSLKRLAIAAGCICHLTKDSISVSLERNLHNNYAGQTFIIDKHESQSGNVFNYTNLGLILDDTERATSLRNIIVRREPPNFSKVLPKIIATEGKQILRDLNAIQRSAVLKALTTESYMLIKGLPGTGKTQTLVAIIRLLHLMGKSVLVTSHTHSAVDNLLVRLKRYGLPQLRLGSGARINQQLLDCSESEVMKDCKTESDLAKKYASYNIVGVTCLGSAHSIFLHRKFDYCIVDEATQVMQCTVLRPLFFAAKFILVGDPEQLPPLIRSKEARMRGADESLFHRLDSEKATSVLTLQYRMNRTITKLANELTYNGALQCASDDVKLAAMKIKFPGSVSSEKWLQRALQTHIDQAVFLLDTLDCSERCQDFASVDRNETWATIEQTFAEDSEGRSEAKQFPWGKTRKRILKYTNYCDAAVIFHIVRVLLSAGYEADRIGIIAPYRAQVELLRKLLGQHATRYETLNFAAVEVNTVDQYQGRDKDIILYSCAKTGSPSAQELERNREAEILEDKRRLTVAITRSKLKLILVGDADCMRQYSPFRVLLERIPSFSKLKLEDGKLGFSWQSLLDELRTVTVTD